MRYRPSSVPPRVEITEVIGNRPLGTTGPIRIAGNQQYLSFEFLGRSLRTRPNQIVYLYRMVGHEDGWQRTRDRQVAFEDLPIGDYTFEVRAVDRDLNYSEPAQLQVTIHPDYAQIGLQAGLALSLIGLVFAGVKITRRRRERDEARTELVAERRQRIEVQPHDIEAWSADDFVGTSAGLRSVLDRNLSTTLRHCG